MIPASSRFDQSTLTNLLEADAVVADARAFFSLLDWSIVERWEQKRSSRGRPAHPESAYLKAFLLRIRQGFVYTTQLRAFLVKHPLLVIELGFHLVLDFTQPYGFAVEQTFPRASGSARNCASLIAACSLICSPGPSTRSRRRFPVLGRSFPSMSNTSMPGSKRTTSEPMSKIVTIKANGWLVILTVGWASSVALTKSCLMAQLRQKKNSSGATDLALLRLPLPITGMSCSPNTPSRSMKAISPISAPCTVRRL